MSEKQVTFYTSYAYQRESTWVIPLRIWVREPPGKARRIAGRGARKVIRKMAGLGKLDDTEKQRFHSRSVDFLADSESREVVVFQFDNDSTSAEFRLSTRDGKSKSDRNGLLEGTLLLSDTAINRLLAEQGSNNGWLTFRAVSEDHSGAGKFRVIQPAGVSVISDIDDTIKVTGIPEGERVVLNNTFFREYTAAPCMAHMYQSFGPDVAFHYVSGGPWQMYAPLSDFLSSRKAGFPEGSFHMKNVRTNPFESDSYNDLWKLVGGGSKTATTNQKTEQIEQLLTNFPEREFILIGDSGEHDPEIFHSIRQRYPDQIQEIRIRDVVNAQEITPDRLQNMIVIPPDC